MTLGGLVFVLLEIAAIVVILLLVLEERDPARTLAWAFALLLVPGIGLAAYLLFGMDRRSFARRDRRRCEANARGLAAVDPLYTRFADAASAELRSKPQLAGRLATAIGRQCDTRPLPCEDLEIFTAGTEKFERLLQDILAATDSIHLQYFIWEDDELTRRVCEALAAKVAEGVEVRILYDRVGSLLYRKTHLRSLARAGAQVSTDAPHPLWLNYRDHKKIAVIDGSVGYTGGMNMGQEYADGGRRFDVWRDTHCRFTGPLVADLQRMFATRWYRLNREDVFSERYFPDHEPKSPSPLWGQVAYSGPETEWHAVRNAFLLCILGAQRTLRIQSPYFVPDESIGNALGAQALSGVDVRFMMTGVPDKRTAWYAAFSYIDDFIAAGGRMLQYTAGFFHAKALTVDGEVAVLGTTNFDVRSFALHEELSVFFYDPATARLLDEVFERDAESCVQIGPAFYDRLSLFARVRNAFLRLWSRLL